LRRPFGPRWSARVPPPRPGRSACTASAWTCAGGRQPRKPVEAQQRGTAAKAKARLACLWGGLALCGDEGIVRGPGHWWQVHACKSAAECQLAADTGDRGLQGPGPHSATPLAGMPAVPWRWRPPPLLSPDWHPGRPAACALPRVCRAHRPPRLRTAATSRSAAAQSPPGCSTPAAAAAAARRA